MEKVDARQIGQKVDKIEAYLVILNRFIIIQLIRGTRSYSFAFSGYLEWVYKARIEGPKDVRL